MVERNASVYTRKREKGCGIDDVARPYSLACLHPFCSFSILDSVSEHSDALDLSFLSEHAVPDHSRNIHERFLRHIWSHQYLDQSRLRTCDGKSLKVLDVGKLNLEGGPDFEDALVKIGTTSYAGDVEIHRTVAEWFSHRHQTDPRYNRVVLHVVLEGNPDHLLTTSMSGREIPVLILSEFLSESIQSIWQKTILDERVRKAETIPCFATNTGIDRGILQEWLHKLTTERLELKLRRFEERLKELALMQLMSVREHPRTYGEPPIEGNPEEIPPPFRELTQKDFSDKKLWEQILYEGLAEGLGYAKNEEPFLRLTRSLTLERLCAFNLANDDDRRIAVLFAVAGLLPKIKSLKERESKEYVRKLIRGWNEVRSEIRVEKLHPADWQFFPTRPNNFPPLRISALNSILTRLLNEELFRSIIQTIKNGEDAEKTRTMLVKLFQVQTQEYWQYHYDFGQRTARSMVALGISRITELLINTVVPVAFLYARIFKDTAVRENTLRLYDSFPAGDGNLLTRRMNQQLIRNKIPIDRVSKQQAVIQLYKYYCTERRCAECEVGRWALRS